MILLGEANQYNLLIDPLLKNIHSKASNLIAKDSRVIDIACGNGSLSMMHAERSSYVLGIDISKNMIDYAQRKAQKKDIKNIEFKQMNAEDLSVFSNKEFDISSISMAIHQFPLNTGISILKQMKQISKRIILIDYLYPLPRGFAGLSTRIIERIAGVEHNRNFRSFMSFGGLSAIIQKCELSIVAEPIDQSVFTIIICE